MTELIAEVVRQREQKLIAELSERLPRMDMRVSDEAPEPALARACVTIFEQRRRAVTELGNELDRDVERHEREQRMERGEGIFSPLHAEPLPARARYINGNAIDKLMRGEIDAEWITEQQQREQQFIQQNHHPFTASSYPHRLSGGTMCY